ncbi:hypothetical protein [Maribacter cobaltidurans]|uniref:hypothetical protein n=1 Tax=Maribacter cobaltidurans TaxID=1178778 RepID=UPI0013150E3C|nr:hypothetical protein [Maribacter cobaltidurans]
MGYNLDRPILSFCVRGEKRASGFPPLVLLRGIEDFGQNWNGKTPRADRRSVSAWGGLQWKVCPISAEAWGKPKHYLIT